MQGHDIIVVGASAGETKEIALARPDGTQSSLEVVVREVQQKVLPPLDDELARATSEFDTLEELRADIEAKIREQLEEDADAEFRQAAVDELVKASKAEPASLVVEVRTRELLTAFIRNFDARFSKIEDYNSPKYNFVNIPTKDLARPISVNLSEEHGSGAERDHSAYSY